ncbi:hypothetical protein FACS189425_05990 [Clostridia bacterium]|nr:hypothetical protein FACS189425_05990 [Clostridia bacterium]
MRATIARLVRNMEKKISEIMARKLEYPKTLTDEKGVVFHFVCSENLNHVEGRYLYYRRTDGGYPTGRLAKIADDKSVRLFTQTEDDVVRDKNRRMAMIEGFKENHPDIALV